MKHLLYIFLLLPVMAMGQTDAQNYVRSYVYKEPVTGTDASKAHTSVTYLDGLGRPIQQVIGKMSATGKDVVTHIMYDKHGRQERQYLPFPATTSDLSFTNGAKTATQMYYTTSAAELTNYPYSKTMYEGSPLGRVLKQAAPGDAWAMDTMSNNDHSIKYAYLLNTESIRRRTVTAGWSASANIYNVSIASAGNYTSGQLFKTITQDENKTGSIYTGSTAASKYNTVEEYKNQVGQVVLKRTFNPNTAGTAEAYNTNYLYDQFGNLSYVTSPLAEGMSSEPEKGNYGYQYKYDTRNRVVEKKLPGRAWELYVYDQLDRLIATGPVLNPFGGTETGWLRTYYDSFGRVVFTGWVPESGIASAKRNLLQQAATVDNVARYSGFEVDGVTIGYKPGGLPTTFKLLTVNYYDDYTWPQHPTLPSEVEGENVRVNCKGLLTGTWVRALIGLGNTDADVSYILYDDRGRALRAHTTNYLGGYTETDTKMDFDGTPQYTATSHKRVAADAALFTIEHFTYTAQDRLESHTHKIGGNLVSDPAIEPLASFTYNELGQMVQKSVGSTGSGPLQDVGYKYNIRGWLTDINDVDDLAGMNQPVDLFAFRIGYNTVNDDSTILETPLFNGNIAETYWRSNNDNIMRKYSYSYDKLNRLTNAVYQKPGSGIPLANSYNEQLYYDKNGNITSMLRTGALDDATMPVYIDDLFYEYTGNQLKKVTDGATHPHGFKDGTNTGDDYTYDPYGNMWTDLNKGISTNIKYNHLNLPVEIVFDNDQSKKIIYLYSATGAKLKKTVTEGTTVVVVDYLGGYQYKSGLLQFFPTSEGYVDVTHTLDGTGYKYVYQYKDHLGNVRMDFVGVQEGRNGPIIAQIKEEDHYYPFGLKHMNYNMDKFEYQEQEGEIVLLPALNPSSKLPNNYKYQGQELQDELGLGWYSFKWRNYDPAIGRFMSIDPLAEKYNMWSPYTFSGNRVVDARELEGLEPVEVNKGVNNLIIVALGRAGGMHGDGIKNGKTLFSSLEARGFKDNGLNQLSRMSIAKDAKVITYGGSDGNITAEHIAATIANYRENNPNGTVSLIGHSLGGKNVLDAANLVNNNDAIKNKTINLVMTLEAASTEGARGSAYETSLGKNVLNVLNFNSAKSAYDGGGGNATGSSNETTIKLPKGTDHTNMDNTLVPFIPSMLKYMYNGGNPTKYSNDTFKDAKIIPNDDGGSSY